MKIKLLLLLIICISGCTMTKDVTFPTDNISYFKDERTNICFARLGSQVEGYVAVSISEVPCEKVEKLFQK